LEGNLLYFEAAFSTFSGDCFDFEGTRLALDTALLPFPATLLPFPAALLFFDDYFSNTDFSLSSSLDSYFISTSSSPKSPGGD